VRRTKLSTIIRDIEPWDTAVSNIARNTLMLHLKAIRAIRIQRCKHNERVSHCLTRLRGEGELVMSASGRNTPAQQSQAVTTTVAIITCTQVRTVPAPAAGIAHLETLHLSR